MTISERLQTIQSPEDFAVFVEWLGVDIAERPAHWEYPEIASYLEALAAMVRNMNGDLSHITGAETSLPQTPTWHLFAQRLLYACARE